MHRLNKDKETRRFNNIIEYLNSGEIQNQAMAYRSLNEMVLMKSPTKEQLKLLIPILREEMKDKDSSLRTDCFKTICILGKLNFDSISEFFPILIEELPEKNRFRTQIVLDFLSHIGISNRLEIQEAIKKTLKLGPSWFNESYLLKIYEDYINSLIGHGNQFMEKYYVEFEDLVKNLHPSMDSIKDNLIKKLDEYKNFIEDLKRKKQEEEKLKKKKELARQELKRQKDEAIKRIINKKTKQKKTNRKEKSSKHLKDTTPKKISKETVRDESQLVVSSEEKLDNTDKSIESDEFEFVSFTKLGLKRTDSEENSDD